MLVLIVVFATYGSINCRFMKLPLLADLISRSLFCESLLPPHAWACPADAIFKNSIGEVLTAIDAALNVGKIN